MANLFYSSLIFSLFAGILLVLRRNLNHRYSSRFFYGIWILLLLRLLIPMNIFPNIAPIQVNFDQVQQKFFQSGEMINLDDVNNHHVIAKDQSIDNIVKDSVPENYLEQNRDLELGGTDEKSLNWNNLILVIWLSGVIVSMGLIVFTYVKFKKQILKSMKPITPMQRKALKNLVDEKTQVFTSSKQSSPLVMGIIKPKLILIESLFKSKENNDIELKEGTEEIIRHELVHIKKKDILVKYLYLLARSIHWFNPLIYSVGPVINEDLELSCDEVVTKTMNTEQKKGYCNLILDLVAETSRPSTLYTTNFNGGVFFMKRRFKNIMKSGEKKRGKALSILIALIIATSAVLVSCSSEGNNVDEMLEVPSYHKYPYRAEPFTLFYESSPRIGFQILDGIFIYNYEEDQLEAEFSLKNDAFEKDFYLAAAMSKAEDKIMISGFNPSNGTQSEYYYQYDIANKSLEKINENPEEIEITAHPSMERQDKALKASSWEILDLRYYPEGSEVGFSPFKKETLPIREFVMKTDEENEGIAPMLTLTDHGEFQFTYNIAMSYLNFGKYTVDGDTYTLVTDDGDRTFVFTKEGERLIFNEEESFESIMTNGDKLQDGAIFE